jgi:putative thymidine phosphorylase
MKLKIKFLDWSAGIPVAMLDKRTADKLGVHLKDRILIKPSQKNKKEFSTIVDTVEGLVKINEIAVSTEIKEILSLKSNQTVDVSLAPPSESLEYIKKKLNKGKFTREEIFKVIQDITDNSLSEAEIALFISAMYEQGMTFYETEDLIDAILASGQKLKLNKKYVVDKHCIGGIPGNRTTPLVVSICAAAGLTFPKTSSRAITSAAGTSDVIETVAEVSFPMKKVEKIIEKTNACLVWGGALGMVPADSKIIQVEKLLKIDPQAQLLASIMSKKLAVGSKYILIDLPYGKTAKVKKDHAFELKKQFEKLGRAFGVELECVLTDGSQPIGNGVGPVLEMIDIINILDPKEQGPRDLEEKSLFLAGKLFEMTGKSEKGKGKQMAREILYSGKAFIKFKEIIKAQKGDLNRLKGPKLKKNIIAPYNLKIKEMNNKKINNLARIAGCPVDKFAGLYLHGHVNSKIHKGEPILTIYSENRNRLKAAIKYYNKEKPITFA